MKRHIFQMTQKVDDMLKLLMDEWPPGTGRNPKEVQDGDIVFLLGHGGGRYTRQFIDTFVRFSEEELSPANKIFVLLMCGQGQGGGSAQLAELIVKMDARSVVYCNKPIMLIRVLDMPAALGIANWEGLLEKEDGELWQLPGANAYWTCLSNADGQSLALA